MPTPALPSAFCRIAFGWLVALLESMLATIFVYVIWTRKVLVDLMLLSVFVAQVVIGRLDKQIGTVTEPTLGISTFSTLLIGFTALDSFEVPNFVLAITDALVLCVLFTALEDSVSSNRANDLISW